MRRSLLVAAFAALGFGCATGPADDVDLGGVEELEDEATSSTVPPPPDPSSEEAPLPPSEPTPPDPGGGGDAGTSPPTCTTPTNTCALPVALGQLRVDEGSDVLTASGTTTTWFKVRALEGDTGGPGGKRMKLKATLTSPPGANYDVYLYLAGNGSAVSCTGVTASGTTSATTDQALIEWGEHNFFNGEVDDRWVMVEVRYVSGPCAATDKFSLSLVRW